MFFLIIIPKIFRKVKWCFRDFRGGNLDLGERGKKPHTFRTYRGTGRPDRGPPQAPRQTRYLVCLNTLHHDASAS